MSGRVLRKDSTWTPFPLRPRAPDPYPSGPVFLVSGTRCSGATVWMKALEGAGIPVVGKSFPRDWDGNAPSTPGPEDQYHSLLRGGIYYRTNPHPVTGRYFVPEDVQGCAVNVVALGVVRTERAYIEKLVANVRDWREYEGAISRLEAEEDEARTSENPDAVPRFRFPPAYEWWMENFAVVRDIGLRRYPARLMTCAQIQADPVAHIADTLAWLGVEAEVDAMAAVAAREHPDFNGEPGHTDVLEPEVAQVFDDFYGAISPGTALSASLLGKLYETNAKLLPRLRELKRWVELEASGVDQPPARA